MFEVFYGTGGHCGPFQTLDEAKDFAKRSLAGSAGESRVSVRIHRHEGDPPLFDRFAPFGDVVYEVRRCHCTALHEWNGGADMESTNGLRSIDEIIADRKTADDPDWEFRSREYTTKSGRLTLVNSFHSYYIYSNPDGTCIGAGDGSEETFAEFCRNVEADEATYVEAFFA